MDDLHQGAPVRVIKWSVQPQYFIFVVANGETWMEWEVVALGTADIFFFFLGLDGTYVPLVCS